MHACQSVCFCEYKIYLLSFVLPATDEFSVFKNVSPHEKKNVGWLSNVKLTECKQACYQHPLCKSYEYNEKLKRCGVNMGTQFPHDLKPNNKGWDVYIMNTGL